MRYPGFLGGSNAIQSPYADAERLINWYVEPIESRGAPSEGILLPTPGFRTFATTSAINTRAIMEVAGMCFAVIGATFCQVFATGTITVIAAVAEDSNPATISYSGTTGGQFFITSGGNGYCYTLSGGAFEMVLDGEATMGGCKDGRFLAFNIENGKVRLSGLNDGTTWDPLLYFQRTIAPDPWQAMVVGNPEIWMIGEQTSEAWYDAGTTPQPFAPILSSFMQAGTNAPFSVALNGAAPVFLNHTVHGSATIVQLEGFTPKVISNFAVSTALAVLDRNGTLDQCESFVYQEDGHTFVVFNFAAGRSTWVYDATVSLWHERGRWVPNATEYDVWAPRVHCHAFGKHLVGDRVTGVLSEMNVAFGEDMQAGPVRRLRIPPPIWAPINGRVGLDWLSLRMETGLGLLSGQGSDPIVRLRTSTDARTWTPMRRAHAGRMGQYATTVSWQRCGGSHTVWFPEITVSDPIPWRIAGCDIGGFGLSAGRAA